MCNGGAVHGTRGASDGARRVHGDGDVRKAHGDDAQKVHGEHDAHNIRDGDDARRVHDGGDARRVHDGDGASEEARARHMAHGGGAYRLHK